LRGSITGESASIEIVNSVNARVFNPSPARNVPPAPAIRFTQTVAPPTPVGAGPAGPAPGTISTINPNATAAAIRIDMADAPTIDADLSDPVWARATVIDDFFQNSPNPGDPATERTEVRILYDENNLYIGVYAYDSEPDLIVLRSMQRDGPIFSGDSIRIILDPGLTRRNGYGFSIGPSGGREDSLLQNNTANLRQWNTIWEGRAAVVEDGWVAEFAIPFRSISYDPDQPNWGLELQRTIRHKNESLRWANFTPNTRFSDISRAGTLTGISGTSQGLGLDVQIFGTTSYRYDHLNARESGITGALGGNVYYKITPALTGTVTINPDFSDSPLEARQVNLTRFSLFTPETRDFFLQDAAAFEFGGRGFAMSNNARPFFSRNIGLVSRAPVLLVGGGKLSGEFGGFGIGALSVLTGDSPTGPGQVLSAGRIAHRVLAESQIGLIVTNGDPTGDTENSVAGVDFQYRNSNVFGSNRMTSDFYYERSFSDALAEDDSFGVAADYPNEPWGGNFRFKQVGTNFDPALGFVNRLGIREYRGNLRYLWRFRDSPIRQFSFQTEHSFTTLLDNHLESAQSQVGLNLATLANDRYFLNFRNIYEDVPVTFNLPRDIPVPAGRYEWNNIRARIFSSPGRILQFSFETTCCSFYNGHALEWDLNVNFRPNRFFEIQPGYEGAIIDLPTGSVDIHVLKLNGAISFTPFMELVMQTQYDNISEAFGFSARYLWEYQPGNEIFIGFGHSALIPNGRFNSQVSLFSFRLRNTFQF